jgi:cytochrome c oxidase subunit 2
LAIGWDWWLPPNYSVHGRQMDVIFLFIFWITTIIFFGVQGALVYFLIKYRGRPNNRKGIFSHGNTRLEMAWTIIPAIILIVIALWTKRVWDDYRYNPTVANDPNVVKILVIGQQFKWNVIYPGPDGELGRYLLYPKTTDLKWPKLPEGATFQFPAVPGPAYLPEEQARQIIDNYIENVNPLGKDFDDPNGTDDDWRDSFRAVEVPKGRSIEVNIGSRDVIHDFYLPNFRVKLDAVPGMRGKIYLTATASCREKQDPPKAYNLTALEKVVGDLNKQRREANAVINEKTPGAKLKKPRRGPSFYCYEDKDGNTILRDGNPVQLTDIAALKAAGISEVTVSVPFYWELVCEELCGQGHYTMQDKFIVLDDEQMKQEPYTKYFRQPPPKVAMK